MAGLFGWVSDLLQWFGNWIPRLLIVRATQRGVKYVRGKHVRVLEPGLHLFWPLVTECELTNVARQAIDLVTQTLTTADQVSVIVGGVVVYRIDDVNAFLVLNYDSHDAIAEVALSSLRRVVTSCTFDLLLEDGEAVDAALCAEAQEQLKSFGVTVEYVRLSDLAKCKVLSVIGTSSAVPAIVTR